MASRGIKPAPLASASLFATPIRHSPPSYPIRSLPPIARRAGKGHQHEASDLGPPPGSASASSSCSIIGAIRPMPAAFAEMGDDACSAG